MAPETTWDNLVYVTFVGKGEGRCSLVLSFSERRRLKVFQENYMFLPILKTILQLPASVMVGAPDHPALSRCAQPLPWE